MSLSTEDVIARLVEAHPGRQGLISQLTSFLQTTAPPCIHIHTPFSPQPTKSLVRSILASTKTAHACLHGVECLTPRLVFDRVLLSLADWQIQWNEGCTSFGAGSYSSDLDAFVDGLRAVSRNKSIGTKLVVVIDGAERFKENVPELMVPFTRLAELASLPITTIFISEASWFDLRPPLGASPDPFIMDVLNLSKNDMISTLVSLFPDRPDASVSAYSPVLKPLYEQYIAALHSVCAPFLSNPHELAYLAAACWPCFVSPVLADWRALSGGSSEDLDEERSSFTLPNEDARMRLIRFFTPTFTRALEALYPRTQHARQWIASNVPPPELRLSQLSGRSVQDGEPLDDGVRIELTIVAKFVLVSAFLASVNPAKRDARMVGRAPDERGKKRRGGGARRARGGGAVRIPSRLVGPAAFPLDRLMAILGSLMEEHDRETPLNPILDESEEMQDKDTEMAVGRIQVSATISELVAMRLLHRTTPADKLDGPPAFKCGISQARAFELAREIGIANLADFMWDTS